MRRLLEFKRQPGLALLERINLILRELDTVSEILADQETVLKDFLQQTPDLNDHRLSKREMQSQSLYEGQILPDFTSQAQNERQLKKLLFPQLERGMKFRRDELDKLITKARNIFGQVGIRPNASLPYVD